MTINTQRRIPAAMTKIPPLKRTRSSSFSRHGRRALKSIFGSFVSFVCIVLLHRTCRDVEEGSIPVSESISSIRLSQRSK